MFRYRYRVLNKESFLDRIEYMKSRDMPVGKTFFGRDLYDAGMHFTECGDTVKGFYLESRDGEIIAGRVTRTIRARFRGKFTEKDGNNYFDVFIYPEIFGAALLLAVFFGFCYSGKIDAIIIASVFLLIFGKGFCDLMIGARQYFDDMLK